MKISKLLSTSVGLLLLGAAVAFFWIYLSGGEHLTSLTQPHYGYILALPAITAFCILGRFVRWQFLLRRVKVRVPIRTAFSIFLASLAGTATPAYVGEAIRSVFLRRDFRIPARLTLRVLLVERLFDIMALGLPGALAAGNLWIRVVTALLATGAWLVLRFGGPLTRGAGVPESVGTGLRHYEITFQVLGITLIAWIPAAMPIHLAAASLHMGVGLTASVGIFRAATLIGGATLLPAGVGATGSVIILQLENLGLPLSDGVMVVSLVRLATTGAALAIGAMFLTRELRNLRP